MLLACASERIPEPVDHWQTPLTEEHLHLQTKHTQSNKFTHSFHSAQLAY